MYVYKCNNSTIVVKGKVNAITLDSCKKTAVVFDDCAAAFEIINCQSVQAQITGKCYTVSIDKTDGAQVYLSKDCMDAEIISAKSSEMNILCPNPDDPDADFVRTRGPLFGVSLHTLFRAPCFDNPTVDATKARYRINAVSLKVTKLSNKNSRDTKFLCP